MKVQDDTETIEIKSDGSIEDEDPELFTGVTE
jgi:hypothetical protein